MISSCGCQELCPILSSHLVKWYLQSRECDINYQSPAQDSVAPPFQTSLFGFYRLYPPRRQSYISAPIEESEFGVPFTLRHQYNTTVPTDITDELPFRPPLRAVIAARYLPPPTLDSL